MSSWMNYPNAEEINRFLIAVKIHEMDYKCSWLLNSAILMLSRVFTIYIYFWNGGNTYIFRLPLLCDNFLGKGCNINNRKNYSSNNTNISCMHTYLILLVFSLSKHVKTTLSEIKISVSEQKRWSLWDYRSFQLRWWNICLFMSNKIMHATSIFLIYI